MFSSLNLEAARLARRGELPAAENLAKRAAALEESKDFRTLVDLLSGLSPQIVASIARGIIPKGVPRATLGKLWGVLGRIAQRTEDVRSSPAVKKWRSEVLAGRISEIRGASLVLTTATGESSIIPQWLAASVHRERVGDELAVLTDRLGDSSALALALPALDIDKPVPAPDFDPFARDARVGALTLSDSRKVSGKPAPPRVIVPVAIEE